MNYFDHLLRISRVAPIYLASIFIVGCTVGAEDGTPHLQKHGTATQLIVDDKPFLILGGELHNSSASSVDNMTPVWPRLARMHLNTVILPVSWELIEPTEGQFDFSIIDGLIRDARANNLHLVILWFGSWKNGLSSYPPLWVKTAPKRFPLAQNAGGKYLDILSTFGQATCEADAHAFAALLHHLRKFDSSNHTVVALQVENEVGMREDSRDRSPAANAAFAAPVPAELLAILFNGGESVVQNCGNDGKRWGGNPRAIGLMFSVMDWQRMSCLWRGITPGL